MVSGLNIAVLLIAYRQAQSASTDWLDKLDVLDKHTVRAKQTVKQHRVYTFLPWPHSQRGNITREDKS